MTIKKRLIVSNVLMIVVPVAITLLVGLFCIGFIWLALINGAGIGIHDREDFERASMAITEVVEHKLEHGADLTSLDPLLQSNGLSVQVRAEGKILYQYGAAEPGDSALLSAAERLSGEITITQNGRSLYTWQGKAGGTDYTVCLLGGSSGRQTYSELKVLLVLSALLLVLTVGLSIFLTNRFLTRFVFRRIETPLHILSDGVHALWDGNLDHRICYDRDDEFLPVCADFNEMAGHLKRSVTLLQQQEQSRKELIAGISHDIRSPLTSIQAYVEGLLDGVAKTPEAQRRYLDTIRTKAEELEHMVSQLFLFSKMELGEEPDAPRPLRLDEKIADMVCSMREESAEKGLRIETELASASIWADPLQVERIMTNILENSLKYKDGPTATVRISLERRDKTCLLCFADDGPGVPPEALPRLFEVFYRSDPARRAPNRGSGLGLAIVASAVQRMGGTITAQNGPDGGLEIRIELPVMEEQRHAEDSDCGR